MKDFAIRQMRKEYRGVLRFLIGSAVVILLMASFIGALLYTEKGAEMQRKWTLSGLLLIMALLCFACYLIVSDTGWLLRHTPFGRSIQMLGEPEAVLKDIDRSAQAMYDPHGVFTLLKDWLILQYPCRWRWEPCRSCALPVNRSGIESIRVLPERNPRDPQEIQIEIICNGESHVICVYQQQSVTALRNWMGKGIQNDEG